MKLSEVQTIYYLLHAMQFKSNQNDRIEFQLVVSHYGKLLTADFLPISVPFSPKVREVILDSDGDESKKELATAFFNEVFGIWRKTHEGTFFSYPKAFAEPGWLLQTLVKFVETLNHVPYITSRVSNLNYIESSINFNEAVLESDGYSIVSLIIQ
ncbi:hypothetical protein [Enterococcus avium]|uniref:hypothetical protein n=1 Tax=Enterococcus avium TaxID=33945 RepID=UPI0032E51D66